MMNEYCEWLIRHREDAEDIAQNALTTAYCKLRMLRQPDWFRASQLCTKKSRKGVVPALVKAGCREAAGRFVQEINPLTTITPSRQPAGCRDTPPQLRRGRVCYSDTSCAKPRVVRAPEKLRMVTVPAGIEEHDIREVGLPVAGLELIVIPPLTPLAPEIEGGRL